MRQELVELLERWPVGNRLELTRNSVVYIIGGYKGLTAELIYELYEPRLIRAYEPQDWAFKVLQEVALAHPQAMEAYHYGLGDREGTFVMGEWGTDACSFINVGPGAREHGEGTMIPADWAMQDVEVIDLAMINCEGSEFSLIPYLRSTGDLNKIKGLCIQWHLDLGPDMDQSRMEQEIDKLIMEDGYVMRQDDRPAWTYLTRVRD